MSEPGRVVFAKVARLHAAARKLLLALGDPDDNTLVAVPPYILRELRAATDDVNPKPFLPLTD